MISPLKPTKFGVCVTHMNGACNGIIGPPPGALGRGQISFNFNYKVDFNDFYTKLCVRSHKHIRRDFHYVACVMLKGWDFGALGCPGVQKLFLKHGHVAYQLDRDDEQNRMRVKFHPRVKLVTSG